MSKKVYKITIVVETYDRGIARDIFSRFFNDTIAESAREEIRFARCKLDVLETFHFGEEE